MGCGWAGAAAPAAAAVRGDGDGASYAPAPEYDDAPPLIAEAEDGPALAPAPDDEVLRSAVVVLSACDMAMAWDCTAAAGQGAAAGEAAAMLDGMMRATAEQFGGMYLPGTGGVSTVLFADPTDAALWCCTVQHGAMHLPYPAAVLAAAGGLQPVSAGSVLLWRGPRLRQAVAVGGLRLRWALRGDRILDTDGTSLDWAWEVLRHALPGQVLADSGLMRLLPPRMPQFGVVPAFSAQIRAHQPPEPVYAVVPVGLADRRQAPAPHSSERHLQPQECQQGQSQSFGGFSQSQLSSVAWGSAGSAGSPHRAQTNPQTEAAQSQSPCDRVESSSGWGGTRQPASQISPSPQITGAPSFVPAPSSSLGNAGGSTAQFGRHFSGWGDAAVSQNPSRAPSAAVSGGATSDAAQKASPPVFIPTIPLPRDNARILGASAALAARIATPPTSPHYPHPPSPQNAGARSPTQPQNARIRSETIAKLSPRAQSSPLGGTRVQASRRRSQTAGSAAGASPRMHGDPAGPPAALPSAITPTNARNGRPNSPTTLPGMLRVDTAIDGVPRVPTINNGILSVESAHPGILRVDTVMDHGEAIEAMQQMGDSVSRADALGNMAESTQCGDNPAYSPGISPRAKARAQGMHFGVVSKSAESMRADNNGGAGAGTSPPAQTAAGGGQRAW